MADRWHHSAQTKMEGPISWARLQRLARDAILKPTDLVRKAGIDRWVPAAQVEGLFPKRRRWYYTHRGMEFGPVSGTHLRELAAAGMLEPTDFVWRDGFDRWRKAKRLVGLFPASPRAGEAPAPNPPARASALLRISAFVAVTLSLVGVVCAAACAARSSRSMPARVAENSSQPGNPRANTPDGLGAPPLNGSPLVPVGSAVQEVLSNPPVDVEGVNSMKPTDLEWERAVGLLVYARVVKDQRALDPSPLLARVEAAARLLELGAGKDVEYHFVVLDSDVVNAFSHIGGYVYVSRALFNLVANDVELAWVLGHEIAHLDLRHGSAGPSTTTDGAGLDPAGRVYNQIAAGYTAEEEYAADEWVSRRLAGLGYSHRQCMSFPKRYRDYLERSARRDVTAAAIPATSPAVSAIPVDQHWLTLPKPDSRLKRLENLLPGSPARAPSG